MPIDTNDVEVAWDVFIEEKTHLLDHKSQSLRVAGLVSGGEKDKVVMLLAARTVKIVLSIVYVCIIGGWRRVAWKPEGGGGLCSTF
jgi:hypothetical protein